MMFEEVENKEQYFIQPYVEGQKCLIKIYRSSKGTEIRAFDENDKKLKVLTHIKKQLKRSYESSKYKGFEIYLKGFFVSDAKNKTFLMIYDILLKDEYEQRQQSKRYQIRYENLVFRFLSLKSTDVRMIFSYNFCDENLNAVIKQFIMTNRLERIVFRKNVPYKYEENDIIVEDVWTNYEGIIVGFDEGTVIHKEFNDNQEVISESPVSCVKSFKVKIDNESIVDIPIDYMIDSEKTKYFETINDWMNHKCNFRQYKILDKTGYVFVSFE